MKAAKEEGERIAPEECAKMMEFGDKPTKEMVWDHYFDLIFNNVPGFVVAGPFSYIGSFFKIFVYLFCEDCTPRGVYDTPEKWKSLMMSRNTEDGGWEKKTDDDFNSNFLVEWERFDIKIMFPSWFFFSQLISGFEAPIEDAMVIEYDNINTALFYVWMFFWYPIELAVNSLLLAVFTIVYSVYWFIEVYTRDDYFR